MVTHVEEGQVFGVSHTTSPRVHVAAHRGMYPKEYEDGGMAAAPAHPSSSGCLCVNVDGLMLRI